jgi:hypothetical protein
LKNLGKYRNPSTQAIDETAISVHSKIRIELSVELLITRSSSFVHKATDTNDVAQTNSPKVCVLILELAFSGDRLLIAFRNNAVPSTARRGPHAALKIWLRRVITSNLVTCNGDPTTAVYLSPQMCW